MNTSVCRDQIPLTFRIKKIFVAEKLTIFEKYDFIFRIYRIYSAWHHLTDLDLSQPPWPQIYVDIGVQNVDLFLRIFYKRLGTL